MRSYRIPASAGRDKSRQTLSSPAAAERFERLRSLRQRLANEQGVPAYVIFHDATLKAIAEHCPDDLAALSRIAGVGDRKLERYGRAVIETLHQPS